MVDPIVPGVKTQLLSTKPVNQNRFNEAKLREGKQRDRGIHDRIFLRHPGFMPQSRPEYVRSYEIGAPMERTRRAYFEKLWSLKPNSCDDSFKKLS
ncbi:hypothetical protein OUZ56_033860, partial [Daphnia magna]